MFEFLYPILGDTSILQFDDLFSHTRGCASQRRIKRVKELRHLLYIKIRKEIAIPSSCASVNRFVLENGPGGLLNSGKDTISCLCGHE